MQNKIGNVEIKRLKKTSVKEVYSDGDVEDELLKLFKEGLTDEERHKILNTGPSWATRYHLAYERGNLLNWYDFKEGSSVLEVGSGCGAITEVLVNSKARKVASNELSERRATINAYRNSKAENLEIVIGNLQDFKPTEKFDYVVCVGVLEYAGMFIESKDPYPEFLNLLNSFLKPGGTLLLAIENRMGMKYLAGAREDHTGGLFDGINLYPGKKKVQTFGKKELTELIEKSSFKVHRFYYPYPDYKLPSIIYSDNFYPGKNTTMRLDLVSGPAYDQQRYHLFSDEAFMISLEKNDLFRDTANSFLVAAIKK